ncbi:LCP family protein [Kitasatospora sp. NPDC004240]
MAEDDHPSNDDPAGPDPTGDPPPSPGRRRRRWPLITAGALFLPPAVCGALALAAYLGLDGNIRADSATDRLLERLEAERPARDPGAAGAENILLIGSDRRTGAEAQNGPQSGLPDTTVLLHLAADRRRATAVAVPHDVMVTVPACGLPDGTRTAPRTGRFEEAYRTGGAACSIRAVEQLSGIRIDHHLMVDLTGLRTTVDAVHGVEVCVPRPVHDQDARLDLPAGRQTLRGGQALRYVRAREDLGEDGDTERMSRQQRLLAALAHRAWSREVLLNPARLWPVLDAATGSVRADAALASLGALYGLARDLRGIPPGEVALLTAPRRPYRYDSDREEFVQPRTGELFTALRADRPVTVRSAAPPLPSATAARPSTAAPPEPGARTGGPPVFEGRTADADGCPAR